MFSNWLLYHADILVTVQNGTMVKNDLHLTHLNVKCSDSGRHCSATPRVGGVLS